MGKKSKTRRRSQILKVVKCIWSYAHRRMVILFLFFFDEISMDLMKSQGDLPEKWISGNRQ